MRERLLRHAEVVRQLFADTMATPAITGIADRPSPKAQFTGLVDALGYELMERDPRQGLNTAEKYSPLLEQEDAARLTATIRSFGESRDFAALEELYAQLMADVH